MRIGRETEVLGENLPQRHFFHHNPTWPDSGATRAAAVGSHRLTAWAMAWPWNTSATSEVENKIPPKMTFTSDVLSRQETASDVHVNPLFLIGWFEQISSSLIGILAQINKVTSF
jgi:hypothetical protein